MIDQFLQTKAWAKFQAAYGRRIHQIDDQLLIRMPLPMGKCYLYSPRGPQLKVPNYKLQILPPMAGPRHRLLRYPANCGGQTAVANKSHSEGVSYGEIPNSSFQTLTKQVTQLAKQQGAIFWRFEPILGSRISNLKSRIKEVKPVQPKHEWILDITKSEEELLKQMKPKTRYNIKLAVKRGVKIRVSSSPTDFETFWCLTNQTIKRKGMKPHPKLYYQKMVEVLGQNQEVQLKLYLAEYQSKIICANIMIFSGNCANYVHGASSNEYRNVMAPYLIQWQAIQDAKARGYQYYNFGGVNPEDPQDKFYQRNWEGITRFKQGFFGQWVSHPGTFDLPISRFWYRLYRLLKAMF